jgi:hypothetical protein
VTGSSAAWVINQSKDSFGKIFYMTLFLQQSKIYKDARASAPLFIKGSKVRY